MANVSDPLVNALSGSDPQNLMEYITRQKIYDSRYWKEQCFGLTVADVLEKAAEQLTCIGDTPTKFLALILKLLQLHPETELVVESFIQQEEFKYVRALGCLYIRLTARPQTIYETLEPFYRDRRKLRRWNNATREWSIQCMDELIHQLLMDTISVGITLPRLPSRYALEEAGYLVEGSRVTALRDVLEGYGGDPLAYLRYKVEVERSPAAILAWERRRTRLATTIGEEIAAPMAIPQQCADECVKSEDGHGGEMLEVQRPKKKHKTYGNLFKKESSNKKVKSTALKEAAISEQSEDYWNEQRANLGLKPLRD